jgi:hypothetical protein
MYAHRDASTTVARARLGMNTAAAAPYNSIVAIGERMSHELYRRVACVNVAVYMHMFHESCV